MIQHHGEEGVSEVIGVILLISVTVLAVAVVMVVLLSGSQPDAIPHATIVAGNSSSGSLTLAHEGGDPLRAGDYRIYVDTGSGLEDRGGDFTGLKDGAWSVGGRLVYNGPGTPKRVVVTAVSGGTETILAEPEFWGGAEKFSPDPVGPVGTVTPVPPPESIVTILYPEGEGGIPLAAKAEIKAKITSNQTEYAHMILYNYGVLSGSGSIQGGQIEARNMTRTEIDEIFSTGEFNTNNLGNSGDLVAVVVIAYDENDTPIASLPGMGILQS